MATDANGSARALQTNLEETGQNARLRVGVITLGLSLLATVVMVRTGLPKPWRLLLFLPFLVGAFGAWQGLFRVCPGLAFKGMREDGAGGEERIARAADLAHAKCLAGRVLLGSVLTAALSTGVILLLP